MSSLPNRFVRVCGVEDIPLGEGRAAIVGDACIALFRTEHGFSCTDAACSHKAGPLADGIVSDISITCPLHARRFDLATGLPIGHDCSPIAVHPVEVRGGAVYVCVRGEGGARVDLAA